MSRRSRIAGFGSAALLVLAGALCAIVLSASLGENLALVLISLGLIEAVSLVFLEVGFSEDRERAREQAAKARDDAQPARERPGADAGPGPGPGPGPPKHADPSGRLVRPRLSRMRGRPRRLR
jgi:hypothetical protein